MVAVAQDGLDQLLRIAARAQLVGARERVLVGEALVVEVVQQAGGAPRLELVAGLAELVLRVPADGALDRPAVLAQRLGLRPLAQQRPGFVTRRHPQSPSAARQ